MDSSKKAWNDLMFGVDTDLAELLDKMLDLNRKKRPTVQECLDHKVFGSLRKYHMSESRQPSEFDWTFLNDPKLKTTGECRKILYHFLCKYSF